MPRSDSKQDSRSESKDESKRDVGAEAKAGGYVAKESKGDGGDERSTAAAAPPAAAAAAPKESKGDGGDERSTAAAADAAAPPVAAAAGPTASTMKFGKDEVTSSEPWFVEMASRASKGKLRLLIGGAAWANAQLPPHLQLSPRGKSGAWDFFTWGFELAAPKGSLWENAVFCFVLEFPNKCFRRVDIPKTSRNTAAAAT